ncbi:uncharacterized protein LOC116247557 [Nymphaea colorata]|uniref:uncharacterized protein LOC116247557 n=1 Tax=Nymphaea colorata TaxID=210225 RepID=UPI00129D5CBF|nr:uncharacterized protein LOC116247557 [Nymphaea colorata]
MGFGDYLSSKAEAAAKEREATKKKVAEQRRPELMQLLATYQARGMTRDEAQMVVNIFSKYEGILVQEILPLQEYRDAMEDWTGDLRCLPALRQSASSLLHHPHLLHRQPIYQVFRCLSAISGCSRAAGSGNRKYLVSLLTTLCNGAMAAAAAYFIRWSLSHVSAGL